MSHARLGRFPFARTLLPRLQLTPREVMLCRDSAPAGAARSGVGAAPARLRGCRRVRRAVRAASRSSGRHPRGPAPGGADARRAPRRYLVLSSRTTSHM